MIHDTSAAGWPRMMSIYVIAYNRPDLLALQVDAFRRHLRDPHRIVVINNGQGALRDEIDDVALRLGLTAHLVLRPNHTTPNYSHARALEFAYEHCVLANGGLSLIVDHDIFPYRSLSPRGLLMGAAMAGVGQSRAGADGRRVHYLHPGLLLLDLEAMPRPETLSLWPDRVEGVACDVGGHLWEYWSQHPDMQVRQLTHKYVELSDEDDLRMETFGETFVHYLGASNWNNRPPANHSHKTEWLRTALEAGVSGPLGLLAGPSEGVVTAVGSLR